MWARLGPSGSVSPVRGKGFYLARGNTGWIDGI
jgi:hypothetical protein